MRNLGAFCMEHSVEAYLKRMSAEELKIILNRCIETAQYAYLLPLIKEELDNRQKE